MRSQNEYVTTTVVSPQCANRDCPNKSHEGTFKLVRFRHPNPVRGAASHRPYVDVWACAPCADTITEASSPSHLDHTKLLTHIRDLIGPVIEGKCSISLAQLIMIQEQIQGAIGAQEVRS